MPKTVARSRDAAPSSVTSNPATELGDQIKPRLRGWLHTVMAPLALLGGVVLLIFTPTVGGRVAAAVYMLSAMALFGNSAVYHRGNWTGETRQTFRRVDHANIFVFIAGSYTPLAYQLLTGQSRVSLLVLVWTLAVFGVIFRVFWLSAPRWLYTVLYLAMGWAAIGWWGKLWVAGGPLVGLLVAGGGLVYSLGAIVYARKRPNPSPEWFGFHEIFHAATVIAAALQYAAICVATFR